MLFDPKWQKGEMSLAGFAAWLETQDPNELYDWGNVDDCACARYAKSVGLGHGRRPWSKERVQLEGLAVGIPSTYGALLDRVRAAMEALS